MDLSYLITPFFAWLASGSIKFAFNTFKEKRLAFDLIGYGGLPSTHSSIVASTVAIIFFKHGYQEPAFVVALALAFIVILDASSLRQQVGDHAKAINELKERSSVKELRERIGHKRIEIVAGVITGLLSAAVIFYFF